MTSYFVVPQAAWKGLPPEYQRLEEPRRMSRIDRIETVLEQTDGGAMVAQVELESKMLPKGERDGTTDLPDIARADNFWGAAIAFGLMTVFPWLHSLGLKVKTVDVYYDNRNLKREHIVKMQELVTKTMPEIIRNASRELKTISRDKPNIRRFQGRAKAPANMNLDQFQTGITVAHTLLQNWRLLNNQSRERIAMRDIATYVADYIAKFLQ